MKIENILLEPDRPGEWLWRESTVDGWQAVFVGLMNGGGALFCRHPLMGDFDAPEWRGDWQLASQAGPAYGRKAKPKDETKPD